MRALSPAQVIGRYELYGEIGCGGMATVHCGRLRGDAGFSRKVAIKKLHPFYAREPEFVAMFLDEARLAAHIRHPNVIPTLDVVAADGELLLVMEYVHGESLARVLRQVRAGNGKVPVDVVSAISCATLHGLHAAHEATGEDGRPLDIVHRDVSPQNILVGGDGVVRVLDFGVAKVAGQVHTTRDGQVKGKLAYMPPEQLHGGRIDRRADVFAAGAVLWETLTAQRLFGGDSETQTMARVMDGVVEPPSRICEGVPASLDAIVLRALDREASRRFGTAREMALAIEAVVPVASPTRVAAWLDEWVGELLSDRARAIADMEEAVRAVPAAAPRASGTRLAIVGAAACILGLLFVGARREGSAAQVDTAPAAAQESPPVVEPAPSSSEATSMPTPMPDDAGEPPRPRPSRLRSKPAAPRRTCVPSYVDDVGIKHYRSCP